MRRVGVSCSVLLALALLGACGSSAKSGAPASNSTTPTSGGSGSSSDFSSLVANASKQRFKITYTDSDGKDTTYAQDGKGNSVFTSGDSSTFFLTSGAVRCTTSGGKSECTALPGGSAANPFATFFAGEQNYVRVLGQNLGHTSTKTIAGRDAQCVTFSADVLPGSQLKGSATYCNDQATGVLLEISGTDNSGAQTNEIVVTKFETPSDSDFTPPATPRTIPSVSIPNVTLPTIPGGG